MSNETGHFNAPSATPMDIPTEKQSEERIRRIEERLHLAFDSARAGSWEWNVRTNANEWSDTLYDLYGVDKSVVPSYDSWLATVHPDDRVHAVQDVSAALIIGAEYESEWRVRPDKGERWLLARGRPLKDADGNVECYIGIVIDITRQKLAEQAFAARENELHRLRNQLDKLLRRQIAEQTIAAVAHDLNQPLNAAATFSEALRRMVRQNRPQEAIADAAERINSEVQRAGNILRELLFSLQQDSGETEASVLDINTVTTQAVELFRVDKLPQTACVTLDLAHVALPVIADVAAIEKVILNLLRNACDAINCGRSCCNGPNIHISTQVQDGMAVIRVEDNGPGVAPAIAAQLFQPFRSDKPHGIGMGLAISRRLVELHGGRIWHEPLAVGTAFFISLPLAS
jgi:PAS domain S-box-containing protein